MNVLVDVVAWVLALALVGAVLVPIVVAFREPVREWRQGRRKDALVIAAAVGVGLAVLVALSQVVP